MPARTFDFEVTIGRFRAALPAAFRALVFLGVLATTRPACAQDLATFERDFDQNIQRVPFAWILVKDDAGARQQLLDVTKAAYAKTGWHGANGAMLDWMGDRLPKVTALALRADAAHIVAYGATMPPLLRALQDQPAQCKALLSDRNWPPYPVALRELTNAALALAAAHRAVRTSAAAPWDTVQAESEAEPLLATLSAGPVPIPSAELRALREPTLASDGVFCAAVIRLYENALALPEAQAAQAIAVIMSAIQNGRWASARDAEYGGDRTRPLNFRLEFDIAQHANPHLLVSIGPMAVLGVGALLLLASPLRQARWRRALICGAGCALVIATGDIIWTCVDYTTLLNAAQTDRYRTVYGVVRNYHQLADGDVSFQVGREWFQLSDRFPTGGYNYAVWHDDLIHDGNYVGIAFVARDYQDPLSFFVRHYSGNTIVRWADAENIFGPASDEPMVGPRHAKGAVIWNDGSGAPSRTVDITESEPAALASSFRAAGWDVFRLDRTIDDLAARRAAELIADAARHLRHQGYAKVVLMGQSAGAWLSILAAESEDVHAVIANAPAFHGNGRYKGLNATALYEALEHLGRGRLMLSFFREDEWDPGGRAVRVESILASARLEHLVVAEPKEFAGHFAGYSGLFARRFADCALAIAGDGLAPTVDRCEDKAWGSAPGKDLSLPRELNRRQGTAIDRYIGKWYGYFSNGREFMFALVAAEDDEVKAAYVVGPPVGYAWKPRPVLRQGGLREPGFLSFDDKHGPVLNIAAQPDGTLEAKWMRRDGTTSTSAALHRLGGGKTAPAGHLDVRATN